MSSKIDTIFSLIKTELGTLFPEHEQHTNPYDPGENTERQLLQGWGIALGPGFNSERNLSCRLSIQRTINIPLTRARYGSSLDTEKKEENELLLLNDQFTLIKQLEKAPTLNNNDTITRFAWTGDSGIETIFAENDHYILINSAFLIEYFENLDN
jgi:hypothetical protein